MPKISTSELTSQRIAGLGHTDAHHIYNGLDCCITYEVHEQLDLIMRSRNEPSAQLIYDFERGMQAPALDMMRRGFKVDAYARDLAVRDLMGRLSRLDWILQQFAKATWGRVLNANSHQQLKQFFYHDPQGLCLPPVVLSFAGERRETTNREALEKLSLYLYAVPIINTILAVKDTKEKISVLTTEVSRDGRLRTSYNVAGTETGRWSSSHDAFGEGTNLQNITPELRRVFVADWGKKLLHLDLEQAESRATGLLVWATVGDASYLDACESGDLHTSVARDLWPTEVTDRASAEKLFYRHFTYRDMSKRGGHASNYRVTPFTMARHLKIHLALAQTFQESYFKKFPGISAWHHWVAKEVGLNAELVTPLGRARTFYGRASDDATIREAIAYAPQSTVGDMLNLILWRLWDSGLPIELLTQEHDGLTLQFPDDPEIEANVVDCCTRLARVPITMAGRVLVIPCDISVGWNWAKYSKENPNGLLKYRGRDDRHRIEGLDRAVS
jgi:DNA polymerase-1